MQDCASTEEAICLRADRQSAFRKDASKALYVRNGDDFGAAGFLPHIRRKSARLRCAPGVGDAVLDQVLPLDPEIVLDLPADLIGKVLTSQTAMRVLHEFAQRARQVK
jgi:hypothetical protein